MISVTVTVIKNTLVFSVPIIKKNVDDAIDDSLQEGGKELTDYIKYQLLDGQLVKKRTGELQRGIYFRKSGHNKISIFIRGPHALVGKWVNEGLSHTWMIRPRNAKLLHFHIEEGDGGHWVSTTEVHFPGIGARHFIQAGAEAKKERIRQLLQHNVQKALRLRRAG